MLLALSLADRIHDRSTTMGGPKNKTKMKKKNTDRATELTVLQQNIKQFLL